MQAKSKDTNNSYARTKFVYNFCQFYIITSLLELQSFTMQRMKMFYFKITSNKIIPISRDLSAQTKFMFYNETFITQSIHCAHSY